MKVLGISAFYHDSAACLVVDGVVVAAAEEERFTGIKHDHRFPLNAVKWVLHEAGIKIEDIDKVAWYENPETKKDRVLTIFNKRPLGTFFLRRQFRKRFKVEGNIEELLKQKLNYKGEVEYVDHHLSHAAFSFLTSNFKDAAIVTIDGVGEWETLGIYRGSSEGIEKVYSVNFPHSLGMYYSTITAFLGFKPNEGEYKVMGLAPYGNPNRYYDKLISIFNFESEDLFEINQKYFTWEYSERVMFNKKFCKLIGLNPRLPEEVLAQEHKDFAAAAQKVYEVLFMRVMRKTKELVNSEYVCLGGGCAYNGVANTLAYNMFDSVHIPFAPSDAGSAMGAALYVGGSVRAKNQNPYLGPEFTRGQIRRVLGKYRNKVEAYELSEGKLITLTAELLHSGNVIGWFQGKMEFGARALGNRSILASPLGPDTKDRINRVIKKREGFRPFAPSCIEDKAEKFFHIKEPIPYMNQITQVRKEHARFLPAITHVDGSARVQTVNQKQNDRYYKLLTELGSLSGYPIVLNTSFNFKDQTITMTPEQAIDRFLDCNMNYLVINNFLIRRKRHESTDEMD